MVSLESKPQLCKSAQYDHGKSEKRSLEKPLLYPEWLWISLQNRAILTGGRMHKKLSILVVNLLVILLIGSVTGSVQAQSATGFQLYPGGNNSDGVPASQSTYNVFFDQTYTYSYSGGSVCLSSRSDQCKPPAIDDYVIIWVNGNKVLDEKSYTHDFGPVDFTPFLRNGINQIHVQLIDLMGPTAVVVRYGSYRRGETIIAYLIAA